MADKLRFDGKVAIVTGAGSGLGRAYSLALAERGARVVVNDIGVSYRGEGLDTTAADSVVAEIRQSGGVAVACYDSVEYGQEIVQAALIAFGRVDIVINNAGIRRDSRIGKSTDEDWDMVMKASLFGTFSVTRHAWGLMQTQRSGRIVNIGSWAGLYGDLNQTSYAAAKMAVFGLTKALAKEGEAYGITVNAIVPFAASRLSERLMEQESREMLTPEKVAPVVLFLAHSSCAVNGEVIEAGGGFVDLLRWQRSKGAFFTEDFSPEDLVARWKEVDDYKESDFPVEAESCISKVNRLFENDSETDGRRKPTPKL